MWKQNDPTVFFDDIFDSIARLQSQALSNFYWNRGLSLAGYRGLSHYLSSLLARVILTSAQGNSDSRTQGYHPSTESLRRLAIRPTGNNARKEAGRAMRARFPLMPAAPKRGTEN